MSIWDWMNAIREFLHMPSVGIAQLLFGIALQVLFMVTLWQWKVLAFILSWIALALTVLLAVSGGHKAPVFILSIFAMSNLISIPFLRWWYQARREAYAESQSNNVGNARR
jgi:hypothetical protein